MLASNLAFYMNTATVIYKPWPIIRNKKNQVLVVMCDYMYDLWVYLKDQ